MSYDKALIAGKLRRWEKHLMRFRLPEWDEIPDFGLYMEQTVDLLRKYLDYLPPELKNEEVVTSSAINNYVRRGIMPGPIKKKYYRPHIACLLMICTLKQSLSIAMIQKMIPAGLTEAEMRSIYETYAERHRMASEFFVQQVRRAAGPILDHEDADEHAAEETSELIAMTAIASGFAQLLTQKLLLLEGKTLEDGENIEIE